MGINEIYSDKEYIIMSEIANNEQITQRELSKKLGMSVSTVNIIINKMVKKGLLKMNQTSQRQMAYVLTSKGVVEKADKTANYLKMHYHIMYKSICRIKSILETLINKHDYIGIWIKDEEMKKIIKIAVDEVKVNNRVKQIVFVDLTYFLNIVEKSNSILVYLANSDTDSTMIEDSGIENLNIYEYL